MADASDIARDFPALLAQAETALARRRSSYPGFIRKGVLSPEAAEDDLRGWELLVEQWRCVVKGTGKMPDIKTLPDRMAAIDLALKRVDQAVARGKADADLERQKECYLAMRFHLERAKAEADAQKSAALDAARSGMRPNEGFCPPEAAGRRVHVILRNGYDSRKKEPAGWEAVGRGGCRWTLTGDPFDIAEYQVI